MLARRFLWIIAAVIVLVVGAALAYRLFGARLIAAALVPSVRFADSRVAPPPDYALPAAWAANPMLATDPARWAPPGYAAAPVYQQGYRPLGGKGEAAYWLPLLALYSGARLNELAPMRVGDVQVDPTSGVRFMTVIEDEDAGRGVKTEDGRPAVGANLKAV